MFRQNSSTKSLVGLDAWAAEVPPHIQIEKISAYGVSMESVRAPSSSKDRFLVYLHGGGYCHHFPRIYRTFAARLSKATERTVLLVDYRLAPKFPYPAAIEDSLKVFEWLSADQKIPASQICIGGDSAGGGLLLSTLLRLKNSNAQLPSSAFLVSPWLDFQMKGKSYETNARSELLLNRVGLEQFRDFYFFRSDTKPEEASPISANLKNFPPLLVLVGSEEILLDDSTELKRLAEAAGVPINLWIASGMWHCWPLVGGFLPESRQALRKIAEFCRRF